MVGGIISEWWANSATGCFSPRQDTPGAGAKKSSATTARVEAIDALLIVGPHRAKEAGGP